MSLGLEPENFLWFVFPKYLHTHPSEDDLLGRGAIGWWQSTSLIHRKSHFQMFATIPWTRTLTGAEALEICCIDNAKLDGLMSWHMKASFMNKHDLRRGYGRDESSSVRTPCGLVLQFRESTLQYAIKTFCLGRWDRPDLKSLSHELPHLFFLSIFQHKLARFVKFGLPVRLCVSMRKGERKEGLTHLWMCID